MTVLSRRRFLKTTTGAAGMAAAGGDIGALPKLLAQPYRASYILLGGLDSWTDEVLFPAFPSKPNSGQLAELRRTTAVAEFFGGAPRIEGERASTEAQPELPTVAARTTAPVPTQKKRKAKEGC